MPIKRFLSYEELVQVNIEEIRNDEKIISEIEERIEQRYGSEQQKGD